MAGNNGLPKGNGLRLIWADKMSHAVNILRTPDSRHSVLEPTPADFKWFTEIEDVAISNSFHA